MTELAEMVAGNYRFVPGVFQYSAGVAAMPGYAIERVRFSHPVPMREGFDRIAEHLKARGRPLTAFCACEMRSPEPFTESGFRSFNETYAGVLSDWGIFDGTTNPVARANVCPDYDKPPEPSFHAFSFTVEAPEAPHSFVISGSGEAPEGKGNYKDHIVARGDLSHDGMRQKVQWVLGEMERRMGAFGAGWSETTAVQVYTVHDIHPHLESEFATRGNLHNGLTWFLNRPPVQELEYEMDCRRVHRELVLPA
ncbi:hypothetical protein H0Z60_03775 [Ectothiorhodospiraceae bacterium WFHF3C12]|nr:hypothetical protein [Ectothiorhodospiraceae bacterium WFHF3C12]